MSSISSPSRLISVSLPNHCDIRVILQDGIDQVGFPRDEYLKKINANSDFTFQQSGKVVRQISQIIRAHDLLPQVWRPREMLSASMRKLPVNDQLHSRFVEMPNKSIVILNNGIYPEEFVDVFKRMGFELGPSLSNALVLNSYGDCDTLFSRFYFGENCSFLTMPDGTSFSQIRSNYLKLTWHVTELLNSPECKHQGKLNSAVWRQWLCEKNRCLTNDKRSCAFMIVAHAALNSLSYDIAVASLNGGNEMAGIAAWAFQNKRINCNLFLISHNYEDSLKAKDLFQILRAKYQIQNMTLTVVIGSLDQDATWDSINREAKAQMRICFVWRRNAKYFYGDTLLRNDNEKSIIKYCANYLKSCSSPSLLFMSSVINSELQNHCEFAPSFLRSQNFKNLTFLFHRINSSFRLFTFIFGCKLEISHRDLVARFHTSSAPKAPSLSQIFDSPTAGIAFTDRKRSRSSVEHSSNPVNGALPSNRLKLQKTSQTAAAGPSNAIGPLDRDACVQAPQIPTRVVRFDHNIIEGVNAPQIEDRQDSMGQNLTPVPKETEMPHHPHSSIADILGQYPDLS